jgi:hypothetical protein
MMDNLIGYIIGIPILLFAAYLILAIPYSTIAKPLYLKIKKNKSNKFDPQFIKENFEDLVHYWAGVFDGTIKLEDGSKFNDNTIYNPKYLKYSKKYLEIASLSAAKNAKNKTIYYAFRTGYMWFANFNENVKDKIVNPTQDVQEIMDKYNYGADPKMLNKMIDELAKLPQDEEKSNKIFSTILKSQLAYLKKFDNLTKNK